MKAPMGPPLSTPRVVHVTASCWPDSGGIARHVHDLTGNSECIVVAPSRTNRSTIFRAGGVRHHRVARQAVIHSEPTGVVSAGLALHLRRLAKHTDVFHAHLPFPMALGASVFTPAAIPWIVTLHNVIQTDIPLPRALMAVHQRLELRLLARATAIVVASDDYAATIPGLDRIRGKVSYIPYGIELPKPRSGDARHEPRQPNLLLFVGRLAYYKGVHVLLRALALTPGAQLAIVGEGPEQAALRALALQLDVDHRVTWHGRQSDQALRALYRSAAALVLPSTGASESFGLVQVEAHAHGMPVICSNLPGLRVVNVDGVTGLLTRAGDVHDLARAMRTLLSDPELRLRLGAQAASRARESYARERMIDQTHALYARVLDGSSSA